MDNVPIHEFKMNKILHKVNEDLRETHPALLSNRDQSQFKKRMDKIKYDVDQLRFLQRKKAAAADITNN